MIYLFNMLSTTGGEILLASILGVVGTFIVQAIKKVAGASGNVAFLLTIAVSGALGFVTAYMSGSWDASNIATSSAVVFSLATAAYRLLLSNDAPIATLRN